MPSVRRWASLRLVEGEGEARRWLEAAAERSERVASRSVSALAPKSPLLRHLHLLGVAGPAWPRKVRALREPAAAPREASHRRSAASAQEVAFRPVPARVLVESVAGVTADSV